MPGSASAPKDSTRTAAFYTRNATLSRRLAMALIVFSASMMLLGPTIADSVLSLLRCQPGNGCGPIANAVGSRFAAFYRADSLIDVPFIFIAKFWALILAWVALIAYVRLRKVPPPRAQGATPLSPRDALHERSAAFRWSRRLAWGLTASLVLFCVLLGTPLLATGTASFILSQLGCNAVVLNFGGPQECLNAPGFWTPRLRDYMNPVGWLLAPFLLVLHFHVLLIGWGLLTTAHFYISSLIERGTKR